MPTLNQMNEHRRVMNGLCLDHWGNPKPNNEINLKISLVYICDEQRHLICIPYSVENLHQMADDLGIKRCWFHSGKFPHYDIPKRRMTEIKSKCIVKSSKELLKTIKI